MSKTSMAMVGMAMLGLSLPCLAAIGPGAQLHLNANDTGSWYGGSEFDQSLSMDTLPNSDTVWNLNTSGAYGHNLGDITNPDGSNVPESTPGAFIGTNGNSLDRDTRRSYNPNFNPASGGGPAYFDGYMQNDYSGARFTMNKAFSPISNITWEMWFRPCTAYAFGVNGSPSPYLMANEHYNNREGFGFYEQQSGEQRSVVWRAMQLGSPVSSQLVVPIAVGDVNDPQEWYHIVGTFGSDGVQNFYVNGVLADSASGLTVGNDPSGNPLGILFRPNDPRQSNADVSIVRIYHRVLTVDDVEQNFNNDAEMFDREIITEPIIPVRTWAVDSGGNWDDGDNWSGGPGPDATDESAVFGSAITSGRTIYTDLPVTVKAVQFDSANSYGVAGLGSVNMEADTGNARIDVTQGDHQFQVAVNLDDDTDADIAASSSLTFNNALNLGGNTLTKTGDGTLSIKNDLATGGGSVVGLAGTIGGGGSVGGDLTNTSATVAPGNSPGTLTVAGDFSQAAGGTLAIELAGTADGEFDVLEVVGSASLGGSLDITELYTPGGADSWTILTAAGGITGSFDTVAAGYQVALANGDTELVLSLSGALLPGDANGDGCVDDLDLTALAVHWQQATNLWEDGDFNGDGIVDDLDLTALAVNWQQGCGGGGSFADALAVANVPEPASVLIVLLGFAGMARRRRRA